LIGWDLTLSTGDAVGAPIPVGAAVDDGSPDTTGFAEGPNKLLGIPVGVKGAEGGADGIIEGDDDGLGVSSAVVVVGLGVPSGTGVGEIGTVVIEVIDEGLGVPLETGIDERDTGGVVIVVIEGGALGAELLDLDFDSGKKILPVAARATTKVSKSIRARKRELFRRCMVPLPSSFAWIR